MADYSGCNAIEYFRQAINGVSSTEWAALALGAVAYHLLVYHTKKAIRVYLPRHYRVSCNEWELHLGEILFAIVIVPWAIYLLATRWREYSQDSVHYVDERAYAAEFLMAVYFVADAMMLVSGHNQYDVDSTDAFEEQLEVPVLFHHVLFGTLSFVARGDPRSGTLLPVWMFLCEGAQLPQHMWYIARFYRPDASEGEEGEKRAERSVAWWHGAYTVGWLVFRVGNAAVVVYLVAAHFSEFYCVFAQLSFLAAFFYAGLNFSWFFIGPDRLLDRFLSWMPGKHRWNTPEALRRLHLATETLKKEKKY